MKKKTTRNKTSAHILNTSANLLGFCLFVITAIHVSDRKESTLLDEFTSVIALLLTISSLLSFFSMQRTLLQNNTSVKFEIVADVLFILALLGIFLLILFILLTFV